MKPIITNLILLALFSNLLSQNTIVEKYIQEKLPISAPQFTDEEQFKIIVAFLKQYYGTSFKYFNELNEGLYEFSNEKGTYIYSLNIMSNGSKKDIIDKIYLKKTKNKHGIYEIFFDNKDILRFINLSSHKRNNLQNAGSPLDIITKNNMLYDQMILYNEDLDPNYWRILNRNFTTEFFVDQHDDEAVLFKSLEAGVIIPWGTNGASSKLITIDSEFESIIYFDPEVLNSGEKLPLNKVYGRGGWGYGQFSVPTGIARGREYHSGNYLNIPIYVSDQHNYRIISVILRINEVSQELIFIDDNSFWEVAHPIWPFDVTYYQDTEDSTSDKIWVSSAHPIFPSISCYSVEGSKLQEFIGYLDTNTNQTYLFDENTKSRLSVYSYDYAGYGLLGFIDNVRNCLVTCQLNPDGTGRPEPYQGSYLIRAHGVLTFPKDEPINSLKFQATSYRTYAWPTVWVTSDNMIHNVKMNCYAHLQYIGSSNCPLNTCSFEQPFHNLRNTIVADDYYDISTIEQWSDNYGVRRYRTYVDVYSDTLLNYCRDSVDVMKFKGIFTNECWLHLQAYRMNRSGNWENVKIKKMNGETINDYTATKFQFAGWNQGDEGLYIDLKLDLPIEDYALGGQIKLVMNMFPEYYSIDFSNPHITKEYPAIVTKTCLPKPGGCPFLYVRDGNQDYIVDNNLLHRSEFSPSVDITDVYKLRINPSTNGGKVEVYLVENEDDFGYIDQVKMYAVDYPNDKKLAITEDNQIVLYDSASVKSSDSVMLNSANITSNVQFHHPTSSVDGGAGDVLSAYFTYTLNPLTKNTGLELSRKNNENPENRNGKNNSKKAVNENISKENRSNDTRDYEERAKRNKWTKDSFQGLQYPVAFISELRNLTSPVPGVKDTAGHLTASSVSGLIGFSGPFARRELNSVVVLPMFESPSVLVDTLEISWQSDFNIKYLGVAALDYSHYTATEMSLAEGKYITLSLDSNITATLTSVDEEYGEVNSSALLKLKFDASQLPALSQNEKREYVVEVTGRYANGDNASPLRVRQEVPLTYRLGQNYPNPFNPVTKINYELPKTTKVNLIVYDILGREVIRLVNNEFKEAGRHTVDFDGKNFASGVYFYRIEVGSFVQSKKMILIK